MKIVSKEKWNDGTLVHWSVSVHEVSMQDFLDEWYDRDAKPNWKRIEEGAMLRAFVVDEVLEVPDEVRSNDEEEPIAGAEFGAIKAGDDLVLMMNPKEYYEKLYGTAANDFEAGPTLINVQDCGFNVEVVE